MAVSASAIPTVVLIHGAWHDASCWDLLLPELRQAGLDCMAPDLPGHGRNPLPLQQISLKVYSNYISQLIDKIDNNVILLGHSMAGMVISQVAETCPERLAHLIYLSAYLPQNGQSLFDLMSLHQARYGETGIEQAMSLSADKRQSLIAREDIIPLFYHQCPPALQRFGLQHFSPQASLPLASRVSLSDSHFGRISKCYIRCSNDSVIPETQVNQMLAAQPCDSTFMLEADHSPFWSTPAQLTELITAIAKRHW